MLIKEGFVFAVFTKWCVVWRGENWQYWWGKF